MKKGTLRGHAPQQRKECTVLSLPVTQYMLSTGIMSFMDLLVSQDSFSFKSIDDKKSSCLSPLHKGTRLTLVFIMNEPYIKSQGAHACLYYFGRIWAPELRTSRPA